MNRFVAHSALAAVVVASPAAMAADRTITLSVKNMDCAACPSIVKASLHAVPGVASVAVSYKDKTATITYDDVKVDNVGFSNAPILSQGTKTEQSATKCVGGR